MAAPRAATVAQGDRLKAYRPIPVAERRAALRAAVAAYRREDWFEAHELLEPAWMGTDDPVERDVYQGLIKLAAAYVHRARGNPAGMAKNLAGASTRLARAVEAGPAADAGITVAPLLADVRHRTGAAEAALPAPSLPYEEVVDAARA
jgi:predicted metal-dependent hydrolase